MKTTKKTKGEIVFGGSIRMSTIEAILSTRENSDVYCPDRMTYLINHKGTILHTMFDIIDGKIKVVGGSLIELNDTKMIYITEDNTEVIEPLTISRCKFSSGYAISENDPIIINWEGDELVSINNTIIR